MVEPKNIPRNEFPKSKSRADGMIPLTVKCDNNEMNSDRGGIKLHIQLIMPDRTGSKPPLIVYVQGSAFHQQNVPQSIPRLCLLANRGFVLSGNHNAAQL